MGWEEEEDWENHDLIVEEIHKNKRSSRFKEKKTTREVMNGHYGRKNGLQDIENCCELCG